MILMIWKGSKVLILLVWLMMHVIYCKKSHIFRYLSQPKSATYGPTQILILPKKGIFKFVYSIWLGIIKIQFTEIKCLLINNYH